MSDISYIVSEIARTPGCAVFPAAGLPVVRAGETLPVDVIEFYTACGGVELFNGGWYPMNVVGPRDFVRSNPDLIKSEVTDDISDSWYIVARMDEFVISIDCHPSRLGRCYDSFWDKHAVPGGCPIVALSFAELLERLLASKGECIFWVEDDFPRYGDAYD